MPLLDIMDSNAYWLEANQLPRHLILFSPKLQQSIGQRNPSANHKEENAHKS